MDAVLTTRQFARLIRIFGIDFATLPESERADPIAGYHKRLFSGDFVEEARFGRAC